MPCLGVICLNGPTFRPAPPRSVLEGTDPKPAGVYSAGGTVFS